MALYDAEITELDSKIAPLLKLADENTIVVVTADHGESFSHDYYFNHRAGLWDEVTHVPLIIGGGDVKNARVSQQIGLIDLLPTVLILLSCQVTKDLWEHLEWIGLTVMIHRA